MTAFEPVRYRSAEEDSARWLGFKFRPGDIVISTRSKSGTTWMQMICALLIFETAELPRPLAELSPWLDWLVVPKADMFDALAAQTHRRFIKTHTPLDGLPLDERATFIVVARHPLDAAVSLYHQSTNLDRSRIAELTGNPAPVDTPQPPPLDTWLRSWTQADDSPADRLDSMNGFFHHLTDAWSRRYAPNIVVAHYADLTADLVGEMQRVATSLEIEISPDLAQHLAASATFDSMKSRSELLAPDPSGVLKDRSAFFRQGTSGAGRQELDDDARDAYLARANELAPPDLLAWLHR